MVQQPPLNDLPAARQAAAAAQNRPARRGIGMEDMEANVMAHLQMALHMSDVENRMNERQMIMMALNAGAGAEQA